MSEILKNSFSSYPKLYALGHRAIAEIFTDEVVIEEKVDGSQFSFGVIEGELRMRSKGCILNLEAPEKMFIPGIEAVKSIAHLLTPEWTYRGEYLKVYNHNTLAYNRIPKNHIIGFDIATGFETYLSHDQKHKEFERIGLEFVPVLYTGKVDDVNKLRELLDTISILGGQKIEGIVVKNFNQIIKQTGQVMIGKFVSEEFKEVHTGQWKEKNPNNKDIISLLGSQYCTPARWSKAVQHLKEAGQIEDDPKDIGILFKEVNTDVIQECESEIKEKLFQWAWPQISRQITSGLPQWYKEQLMKKSLNKEEENV